MEQQQVNFNIDPDKIDARFCDQVVLNTGPFGVSFDFVQQIPHMKMSRVLSRIAMSPQHAKIFSELLSSNVKSYEQNFGEIKLSTKMKDEARVQVGFQTDAGKAK